MSETEPCAASIPVAEQQKLDQLILSEHDSLKPHKGDFIASAMRMFIDEDDLAEAYDDLGEIDALLSDLLGGYSRRRRSRATLESLDWEGGTDKLGERIDADLKDRFKTWVHENTDLRYGEAVALAIREKRLDGYEQKVPEETSRIREQLERIADGESELEGANTSGDSEAATDDEDEDEKNPHSVADKLEKIRDDILDRWPEPVDELGEIEGLVPVAWVDESIDRWCTRADREEATERTKERYYDRIADEFGFVKDGSDFTGADLDEPAFERKPYRELSTEERLEAIHVQLLREADKNRRYQVSAAYIRDEYLDGGPTESTAHSLREKAADEVGFKPAEVRGEKKLRVAPSDVPDELREKAGLTTQDDEQDAESEEIEADAEAKMDAIMSADRPEHARTDGGSESY